MLSDDLRRHIERARAAEPEPLDKLLAPDKRSAQLALKLAMIRDHLNTNENHPTYNESESPNEQPR